MTLPLNVEVRILTIIKTVDLLLTKIIIVTGKVPDTIKKELKVKVQNQLLQTDGYFDETDSES